MCLHNVQVNIFVEFIHKISESIDERIFTLKIWCIILFILLRAPSEEKVIDNAQEETSTDKITNDEDISDAATKIQAGFKGYKVRKEMKEHKVSF